MDNKAIKKQLNIFVTRAKKTLQAQKVILFGSYAQKKANEYSDVDVIVLSKKFAKIPFDKRLDLLYPLTENLYPDFQPLGFTPEEFAKINSTTLSDARRTGVVVG